MIKATYFLVNLGAWLVPFIVAFHPRIRFNRVFPAAFLAITLVAVPFVIWDVFFTSAGLWGFNAAYLSGWSVINLPVEELMFFFFIPFSCLFTYYVIDRKFRDGLLRWRPATAATVAVFSVTLLAIAVMNFTRLYSFVSFGAGAFTLLLLAFFRPAYLVTALLSFVVLLVPFGLVNGILTGMFTTEPVVWYSDAGITGMRAGTIPAEDFSYALVLITGNIAVFEWLEQRGSGPAVFHEVRKVWKSPS